MNGRGIVSMLLVLLLGAAALWWGSDGFTAFTAENARRLEVERSPRPLPAVALEDHLGAPVSLDDLSGKVVLLDFVYTRCTMICVALGQEFAELRGEIERSDLDGRVVLVTVSFDPEHDGPAQLADYANRYGGPDAAWRFVRAPAERETRQLLRTAEVTVVPDGFGGFVHNAAIYVIDPEGRLVHIVDSDASDEALELARGLI
ncbi:MAG: SCO family protein [Thermomicrobiales bacterium]|nr:SCO family protein [Thermomicrobiales bacterium]